MHSALGGLQRQAQRRLLVEAVLTEDDAARADTKQEVAEGCEDSDGLGTQRASCPSRDRACASLRRLRPTAWRCTQPDAHSAASNESEGSEPSSQLLQAVATAGKRLPWAHLAAREEAAAGMGVGTSGRGADGDQTEAETMQGKQQQSAAQDWSWLASPPWGVVPLPPELACRVDPHGRLRPGTCGAAEAIATHAESVASACPPHAHSDPHCAQLHTQLHRMTAAVQQVLAVAAAANLAAEAQAAAAAAANGEASSAPPQLLYDPDWQSLSKRGADGTCALEVASARVHTITEQWVMILAAAGYGRITPEGQQYLRPSSAAADAKPPEPPVLPRSQSLLRSAEAGLGVAADEAVALQTKISHERQLSEKALYPARGQVSLMVVAYRAGQGGGGSTRASRAALKQLLEPLMQLLLKTSTSGGPGPAGSVCSWQQLAVQVSEWSGPCKLSAMWSWLLACVVAEAEADEAVEGLTPPLDVVQEPASRSRTGMGSDGGAGASAGLAAAWRQAAEEVLRGAACFLGLAINLLTRDIARRLDPLAMAAAWQAWLLARALEPGTDVSPLCLYNTLLLGQLPAFTQLPLPPGCTQLDLHRAPPPPPLSYEHALDVMHSYLYEPCRTNAWQNYILAGDDREHQSGTVLWTAVDHWLGEWEQAREEAYLEHRRQQVEELGLLQAWASSAGRCDGCSSCSGGADRSQEHTGHAAEAGRDTVAAAAAAARRLGLEGILEAAAVLRPPAAAIVACLRALQLLRLPPGVLVLTDFLSEEVATLAIAGVGAAVNAAAGASPGGCDVVRMRLPYSEGGTCAAAFLRLLQMLAISKVPAVQASGSVFAFQVELLAGVDAGAGADPAVRYMQQGQQQQGLGPGPGPDHRGPELQLMVCRTFLPEWTAAGGASKWPLPWTAINEWGVAFDWHCETRMADMVAWLRRVLVERRLGLVVISLQGIETINRMLAALVKVRGEMLGQGRDCSATSHHFFPDAWWGEEEQQQAEAPAAANRTDPVGAGRLAGATAAQAQKQLATLKLATAAVSAHVNSLPMLPPEALTQHALLPPQPQLHSDLQPHNTGAASGQPVVIDAHTTAAVAQDMGPLLQLRPPAPDQELPYSSAPAMGCASVADLELHVATVLTALQRRDQQQQQQEKLGQEGAQAAGRLQEPGDKEEHPRRARDKQRRRGEEGVRRRQPWFDFKLEIRVFEVAPGRPWELLLPSSADVQDLERKAEKERLARMMNGLG